MEELRKLMKAAVRGRAGSAHGLINIYREASLAFGAAQAGKAGDVALRLRSIREQIARLHEVAEELDRTLARAEEARVGRIPGELERSGFQVPREPVPAPRVPMEPPRESWAQRLLRTREAELEAIRQGQMERGVIPGIEVRPESVLERYEREAAEARARRLTPTPLGEQPALPKPPEGAPLGEAPSPEYLRQLEAALPGKRGPGMPHLQQGAAMAAYVAKKTPLAHVVDAVRRGKWEKTAVGLVIYK